MSANQDLEVLAVEVRQLRLIAESVRDKLDALSDPHFLFTQHAERMAAVAYLVKAAEGCVEREVADAKRLRDRRAAGMSPDDVAQVTR